MDSNNLERNLWQHIVSEAEQQSRSEPMLASFFYMGILSHQNFASALAAFIANKLDSPVLSSAIIRQEFDQALIQQPALIVSACLDIQACFERDPACDLYSRPFLFFKGYHALQAYRLAHYLWLQGRKDFALFLQNRISAVFDVDIHPAAVLGDGIMMDHATGIVIGETATVGNNVSLLHAVTLGGSGCGKSSRHPQVGEGVLISTGAKLLGNIKVGNGAKIAAGSVVLADVRAHTTVAGVPAKEIGVPAEQEPAFNMNQQLK
ncbi:serine O-acetyltransferase [Oceanicoccus sp. KOV_DT_Chl]|uniref:serine O-acetyltransferase n=1 Tax=Oceanicoccus sp. KOV_DT_Chl TaxID=1904639 RepID=UPI000C7B4BFF|nr:serine O-acetyltransferase [Oceanicoccus sp. KOV_DT_Chl]